MKIDNWKDDSFTDGQNELMLIVSRYKLALKEGRAFKFSPFEFVSIIEYYCNKQQYNAAEIAIEAALGVFPRNFELRLKEVEVFLQADTNDKALSKLNTLSIEYPANTIIKWLQADTYNKIGKPEKAHQIFNSYIDKRLDITKSTGEYQKAAFSFLAHEHFSFALGYLLLVYKNGFLTPKLFTSIALCYDELGDLRKSIYFYRKDLSTDPYSSSSWLQIGLLYKKQNRAKKALKSFEFALAIAPEFHEALFNKILLLFQLKDYALAAENASEYLEKKPDSLEICLVAAKSCMEQDKLHKASLFFYQALSIDENSADAFFGLAKYHLLRQETTESLHFIRKAIKENELNADYWNTYATLEYKMSDIGRAIKGYEKAIELSPSLEEAWLALSDIFYQAGQFDVAIALMEKSYQVNYASAAINFRFAAYLLKTNEEKGMQHLEEGLQIDPEQIKQFLDWFPEYIVNDEVKQLLHLYQV